LWNHDNGIYLLDMLCWSSFVMFTARGVMRPAATLMLVALGWSGSTSAAELEIKKFVTPATAAVKESSDSHTAAKREMMSHQLVRLAAQQYDVRTRACSGKICIGLVLGVGY
jgi:hypothetical protein